MLKNKPLRLLLAIIAIAVGVYYVNEFWGSTVDVVLAFTSILIGVVMLISVLKKF